MSVTLLSPFWLWALGALPLLWLTRGDRLSVRACLLRGLLFTVLIVGLSQPVVLLDDGATPIHVVIVDQSASLGEQGSERAMALADEIKVAGNKTRVHVLSVGGAAEEGSPIGAALAQAQRLIPADTPGAVTLITDGRATHGQSLRAVTELTYRGIKVDVVSVPSAFTAPVVQSIRSRSELYVGQTAAIEVTVEAPQTKGRVKLSSGDRVVAESEVFSIDGETSIGLEFEPADPGFLVLSATLEIDGEGVLGSTLDQTFAVQRPLSVLFLGGRTEGAAVGLGQLLGAGFDIHDHKGSGPLSLDGADLVVIDDRPARDLPVAFQEELARAVTEAGLGLVACGGRGAFGPGGYHDTPIESLLPVEFIQKEEKKDPSTSLAVIIDTSGSMGGNRIRLAKEVARLAIRRLLPHDKVGIVEFYGAKRWAAPLQSAANAIDIQRALNRLDAGGGTVLLPAVEEAFYGLKNVRTRYKHCLILTDAGVESGPYESLMRRMAQDGICVSTVLVGPGRHSEFLVEIASWGNGRYYNASNRFNLPEVMLKQPSTSRLPAWRAGAFNIRTRGGPRWWGGDLPDTMPTLDGYVETRAKPGSLTLMETVRDHHPVISTWRHGLGRVTAIMTEPTGKGTAAWNEWDGYGRALGGVLLRTASGSREMRRRYHVERRGGEIVVRATGGDVGRMPSVHRLSHGELTRAPLGFQRRAVGEYVAQLYGNGNATVRMESADGVYLVSDQRDARRGEFRVPSRHSLGLKKIAAATGGRFRLLSDGPGELPEIEGQRGASARALWPWLMMLALALYLIDVFVRRRPQSHSTVVAP